MKKKLAIAMTDRCSAACEICCFSCSPQGERTLSTALMKDVIRQACEMDIPSVGFTGGEPFLVFDQLLECTSYASSLGMQVTVNSNGFWGRNEKRARQMLKELKEAGAQLISFSADQYHQAFVPIEDLKMAMRLCTETGLLCDVSIMETAGSDNLLRTTKALRPEIYHATVGVHPALPAGKALETVGDGAFIQHFCTRQARCTGYGLFQLNFDGSYYMCCSQFCREIPRLRLGTAQELMLKDLGRKVASDDFLYVMLRDGLGWFVVKAHEVGVEVPDRMCTPCHLCVFLFTNQELEERLRDCVKEEAERLRLQHLLGLYKRRNRDG